MWEIKERRRTFSSCSTSLASFHLLLVWSVSLLVGADLQETKLAEVGISSLNKNIEYQACIGFQNGSEQLSLDLKFFNRSTKPIRGWEQGEAIGPISIELEKQDGDLFSEVDRQVFTPHIPFPEGTSPEKAKKGPRIDILKPGEFAIVSISVPVVRKGDRKVELFPDAMQPFEIDETGQYRVRFYSEESGILIRSVLFRVEIFPDAAFTNFEVQLPAGD